MNVYIIEKSGGYDTPTVFLGIFKTLESAQAWIQHPDRKVDVEDALGVDEDDPYDTVDTYWFDGYYTRIREVALQE